MAVPPDSAGDESAGLGRRGESFHFVQHRKWLSSEIRCSGLRAGPSIHHNESSRNGCSRSARGLARGESGGEDDAVGCLRFRSNEIRRRLSVIAYNLVNLWRRLVLPQRIGNWSLTRLQQRSVKIGGRLLKHARDCHPTMATAM
ncbi:MAG: transposase [Acidobacteriia bacterium]|nr:transposase [Terriglobia bacterium]